MIYGNTIREGLFTGRRNLGKEDLKQWKEKQIEDQSKEYLRNKVIKSYRAYEKWWNEPGKLPDPYILSIAIVDGRSLQEIIRKVTKKIKLTSVEGGLFDPKRDKGFLKSFQEKIKSDKVYILYYSEYDKYYIFIDPSTNKLYSSFLMSFDDDIAKPITNYKSFLGFGCSENKVKEIIKQERKNKMIYGNISRALVYNTDSIIDIQESIQRDFIDFKTFLNEDSIILESSIGDKVKELLKKTKEFLVKIGGKIKEYWSRFKRFIKRNIDKLKKSKKESHQKQKEEKIDIKEILSKSKENNGFKDYVDYIGFLSDITINSQVFEQAKDLYNRSVVNNDKIDYDKFSDELVNIMTKLVSGTDKWGFKLPNSLLDIANAMHDINKFVEGKKKDLSKDEIYDKYEEAYKTIYESNFPIDKLNEVQKQIGVYDSLFKGISDGIDSIIKNQNGLDLETKYYTNMKYVSNSLMIVSSIALYTVHGISSIINESYTMGQKLIDFVDDIINKETTSDQSKENPEKK